MWVMFYTEVWVFSFSALARNVFFSRKNSLLPAANFLREFFFK